MKREWIIVSTLLVSIAMIGAIFVPILYITAVRSRVNYVIDYDVNMFPRREIIDKVENCNYSAYLTNYDTLPIYYGINSYIDKDLLLYLKNRVEDDKGIPNKHTLRYYFRAEPHSLLYLTYSNTKIYSVNDQDNNWLILNEYDQWPGEAWYLNFTRIPYVYEDGYTTFVLNDCIFVKITLEYEWRSWYVGAIFLSLEQYVILNTSLDVLLILINYDYYVD
jgi:hypothetical protein